MDNKELKSILQNALEEQMPASQINLLPAVQTRLVTKKQSLPQQGRDKTRTRKLVFSAMAIVALLAVVLITPPGRAWAQEVIQYFKKINSDTVQLSDEQSKSMNELIDEVNKKHDLPLIPVYIPSVAPEMARLSGCETPQKAQSYHCQVAFAESKLGFDLKELPEQPKDWRFKSVYANTDLQLAMISYELDFSISSSRLAFTQGMGDLSKSRWFTNNPWDVVPADKVETIFIGPYQGEYVKGSFSLAAGNNTLTWSEADGRQRLAWSAGAHWYLIEFSPNLNVAHTMGKDELIHLAESLVISPIATTELLNPAYLTSISDAEKISGLDLKALTLLPMNIDFSYAHYFRDKKQVHLIYGYNQELDIQEWEGSFNKPAGTYEIVDINGREGYYYSIESSESHLFLWWYKDGLNYQMSYSSPLLGEQIDKEQMLLIAESMQDIDDFQKNGKKSYEQIALYEQVLGINIKKFPETPAEWTFTNFYGEPYTPCIDLSYTAKTGQGTLSINQCNADKHSRTSSIPAQSIEQVKIGNVKGQYIVGDFAIADNGKQVWDLTLPVKQLYWQDNGLWLQMILYGESAVQHTKEDLIALAESLNKK